jgi:hypothetical protein
MVFLTLDIPGHYLTAAYNQPSSATMHTLESDGRIGAAVQQPPQFDFGVYAHQVRMAPLGEPTLIQNVDTHGVKPPDVRH